MRHIAFATFLFGCAVQTAAADDAPFSSLYQALGLPEIVAIMRTEGLGYGAEMQSDLLEGRGGARWPEAVSRIYDVELMEAVLKARLADELDGAELEPMLAFFQSELGERIVMLEVSAREAFLEEEIEQMSLEVFADLKAQGDARAKAIQDLAREAELVDNNVVGALNANYAFYKGLAEGGGLAVVPTEDEILADVWAQEGAIREETSDWVLGYLNLALQPLSDAELRAYSDFYVSDTGTILNQALFAAFDEMFTTISFALGRSASDFLGGEEL